MAARRSRYAKSAFRDTVEHFGTRRRLRDIVDGLEHEIADLNALAFSAGKRRHRLPGHSERFENSGLRQGR